MKLKLKFRVWEREREREYGPQAQRATAFHFLISKRFGCFFEEEGPAALEPSPAGTISTSVSIVGNWKKVIKNFI